jgi:hypothetical protein
MLTLDYYRYDSHFALVSFQKKWPLILMGFNQQLAYIQFMASFCTFGIRRDVRFVWKRIRWLHKSEEIVNLAGKEQLEQKCTLEKLSKKVQNIIHHDQSAASLFISFLYAFVSFSDNVLF